MDPTKLVVMLAVFLASFLAVSFPAVSSLHVPALVFFVAKHFGTGVILATAFIHLLDDAFRSLQSPLVEHAYGKYLSRSAGLLILASLLSIFLVEYVSTTYVDHLRSSSSLPSPSSPLLDDRTPLLLAPSNDSFIDVLTNSPRICRLDLHHHHHHHHHHPLSRRPSTLRSPDEGGGRAPTTMGRKRQIVSILVLQLGIMIHSLVIGLTLSVASGSDFTSLTTAIMFHQLFEGLSLGIRIAALPPAHHHHHEEDDVIPPPEDHGTRESSTTLLLEGSPSSLLLVDSSTTMTGSSLSISRTSTAKEANKRKPRCCGPWSPPSLKPTLAFFFALTTPLGMLLGLVLFGGSTTGTGMTGTTTTRGPPTSLSPSMLLVKGVMSAVSAGMLIYAATVEMIAADFVFGDVAEGHVHGHGHGGDEEEVELPGSSSSSSISGSGSKRSTSSVAKRALAVFSLFMGVGMMVLVG